MHWLLANYISFKNWLLYEKLLVDLIKAKNIKGVKHL